MLRPFYGETVPDAATPFRGGLHSDDSNQLRSRLNRLFKTATDDSLGTHATAALAAHVGRSVRSLQT